MAEHRIKRRIVWEKSGVSEIIGTILMLSITVVLFSGVITMVGSLPAPRQTFIVDLKCSLQPVDPDDWTQGVDFRILHQGGQVMNPLWIKIYLTVDNKMLTKGVGDGLIDINNDTNWGVGEWWVERISNVDVAPVTLSPTAVFTITIIDQEKNALVWHETIGEGANAYGPIIQRAWIDSDLATPEVDDYGPIGFDKQFKIYAEIVDPEGFDPLNGLNVSNLWVNVSSIFNASTPPIQLIDVLDSRDAPNDNIYVAYSNGPFKIPIGYYMFIFNASDYSNRSSMFAGRFPVGQIVGEKPQIVVKGDNPETGKYEYITFSNSEPTNGDVVDITATILNLGGKGANVDVWFYMDNITNPPINSLPKTILVPEVGQQDATITWTASPGGVHMIIVFAEVSPATVTADFYDPDLTDNTNYTNISVMPKILLVDDDSHVNDLSSGDTVSFMRASLESADFEYDYTVVGAGDGPGYDYGDYPLMEYDVVIWMTGYRTVKTLTVSTAAWNDRTDDVANLQKYLTGSATGTVVDGLNGGSLWLISEGFWTEALVTPGLATFANDFLHINFLPTFTVSLPDQLYGNVSHPVTDYFADIPINTEERVAGTDSAHYWAFNDIPDKPRIALNDSAAVPANRKIFALSYDSDDYPSDTIVDSRMLMQTWGFSRISDTATQCQYTYKAILWLGDITTKFTQDVAISEQTIEPETVFYKQQVTIKFVVRNNGLANYTTADNLWYLLRIIDMNGIDTIIPHLQRIDFLGIRSNNTLTISYNWTPQQIGYHRISIKIDPYNYIEESNELNNEISSYWGTGELNVLYRVLVVDDDTSHQSLNPDETLAVRDALDYLNYSYELYVVNMTDDGPAFQDGGNRTALSEYNAVIWVTGAYTIEPLTGNDILNITRYMELGGSFWLIGTGLWTSADEAVDAFETDYLKIGSVDGDQNMAAALRGIEDDAVSHGMNYACTGYVNADVLVPSADGIGFTYQNDAMTRYNSVRYKGTTSTNTTVMYRSAVTAWPLSSVNEPLSRAEFVFMMLRWFDKPEERIEVRLSDIDIWITDDPNPHPQLGSGYVIQAAVQNTGGTVGNVLVRFMDGSTQIGSDSISVSPGGWTTAEIIWVPLFAGQRTISVLLDPILQVPEIFPYSATAWSNNIATRDIYVYFFWDNMESGPSKWAHGSTIALINGEGPLEYFGSTAVTIDIEDEWNYSESVSIVNCTDVGFYHTYDKSFWLQEPAGSSTVTTGRGPIDVVFALDTSGSMSDEIDELVIAVNGFLGQLLPQDRAAIWKFNGTGDETTTAGLYEPFRYLTAANLTYLQGRVNALDPVTWNTYTCFYDTLGSAVQYSQTYKLTGRLEYVVGLTDGESNSDDVYTPNANWNQIVAGDTAYSSVAPHPTKGLLYPPCMVYTIGLGIVHDPLYPVADGVEPEWSRTPPRTIVGNNYPVEYDVWHCADSSPDPLHDAGGKYGENATTGEDNVGHYYYTNDPAYLDSIFESIMSSIIIGVLEGEDQTKSTQPGPVTMATIWSDGFETNDFSNWNGAPTSDWTIRTAGSENDYGGQAVAAHGGIYCADARDSDGADNVLEKTVDLTGVTGASLSFWWDNQDIENNDERSYLSVWDGAWQNGIWYSTVFDNDDWQTDAGNWAQATVDLSTYSMVSNFIIRFTAPAGMDNNEGGGNYRDEFMLDDVLLTGTVSVAPWIASTVPANNAIDIVTTANIVITFSEQMATGTVAWTCNDMGLGWTEAWSGGDTVMTLTHTTPFTQSTVYTFQVTAGNDMGGNPLAAGAAPNPWSFTTAGPPVITVTAPADGATNVLTTSTVAVTFSKAMNTASVTYSCVPAVTVWSVVWSGGNTIATYSHTNNFASSTLYTFGITAGTDAGGTPLAGGIIPNPWTFTTIADNPPTIAATTPVDGAMGVAITQNIIITFSEAMNTGTVTYSINPSPGVAVPTWSAGNTILTLNYPDFTTGGILYTVQVSAGLDTTGNALVAGAVPNPWSFRTVDNIAPTIIMTTPSDGSTGVGTGQPIIVIFSEAMNTASAENAFGCSPNPGGWTFTWNSLKTEMTAQHYDFDQMTSYTCTVSTWAEDVSGNNLAATYTWHFTTGVGGGSSTTPGLAPDGANTNKSAVMKEMDLRDLSMATMEFWHKYNMVPGANGGVLLVGYKVTAAGPYMWKYVVPSSAYTGNLRLNATDRVDSYGTFIQWGWNGISGRGTFTWEKVSLNLLNYVPDTTVAGYEWRSNVKVKFQYYQYGGGTGYGWYIDDVRVTVSRPDSETPVATSQDVWQLVSTPDRNGINTYAWWNGNVTSGLMRDGIDNYLMTSPIDLTNARMAYLSAYMKFNLNYASGAPPDGFRVEISNDNGVTWRAVNLGVRSAWNVSGTDGDWEDGYIDGKSYTGINAGNYWVSIGSLTRVNVDLSTFSGNAIHIRFRVVTNGDTTYAHSDTTMNPGFGGFYLDDVQVMGETILG